LVFNVNAKTAPVNANKDTPRKVIERDRVTCMRYPARGADKVIPTFWQRVTMLNPISARFEGRLSAATAITMGGTIAATKPKTITVNIKARPNV